MLKNELFAIVVLLCVSLASHAAVVEFTGQGGDPTVGDIGLASNWEGGVVPFGSDIGRIAYASNVWTGGIMQNNAVRLEGGTFHAPSDLAMRGGTEGAGTTILEIDTTDWATVTNVNVGNELTFWSQYGENMELNILNGSVSAARFYGVAGDKGVVNLGNGVFHADYAIGTAYCNMLAGGTGNIKLDAVENFGVYVDFASDNRGSITIGDKLIGGSSVAAAGVWEWFIANGRMSIDGVTTTDEDDFSIIYDVNNAATISLGLPPWWDDFPRLVDATVPATVTNHHGNFAMTGNGNDPCWGTFFQASGISTQTASIAAFQDTGLKQITYFETYGQSYCLVSELGAWDEINLTPVLHHFWNWVNYGGGTIRWLGSVNFFDDQDFARPYTRTHPRYGGPAMTYPDGSPATGYNGPNTDPRNSLVYDAACSKNVLGELSFTDYGYPDGPTTGLVYIPETEDYAGLLYFKKDSACPLWADYTYASTLQTADAGIDGIWTDNYGPWDSLGSSPVKIGFGEWSVARFRDYLTNSFNAAELVAMGVSNVAAFDIRDHMKTTATGWGWDGSDLDHSVWSSSAWLEDPLWRAYLIYKRQTGTEALSNYYAAVKSASLAGGKPEFLVAGNDIPGFSLGWCRGDLDMVSTEMKMGWDLSGGPSGIAAPPVARYAPLYKLAREHAQSRFVNVWLYNDGYVSELSNPELCNVLYYEMLSTHTFPKFDPGNARVADPDNGITNSGFFEFVEQAAPVYGDRVAVEDIGIYYSSSSILRHFTPDFYEDHSAQPHQFGFWGWGTALSELHYQYRAVPEWKLTAEMLATLRLLVIPNADVLDPADVALLTTWINAGGRLIITGDSGKYLGESGNFELNVGGLSINSIINHPNVVYLANNIGMDYYLAYADRPASLYLFSNAVGSALAGAVAAGVTSTTASSRAGITLYEDESAGKFFIDLNNFDININTFAMTNTGAVTIEAVLPEWLRGKNLDVSVVSPQSSAPAVSLLTASDPNRVKISLGPVEFYAGVVIAGVTMWSNPTVSGSWDAAYNWVPAAVPDAKTNVLWQYATGDPTITIASPAAAAGMTARRDAAAASYWNSKGLQILNHGANTGSLSIGGGSGVLDMWDGGWYGSALYVANEDAIDAANVINAGDIKVRTFILDTFGTASGASYFTHEAGDLTVKVQIGLGEVSESGDEAVFRQTGGNLSVAHADYGLKLGQGLTKGTFILDGGTSSISTIDFVNVDSAFEFNNGTFSSGARDVVWKGTTSGTLYLAETGVHTFDVAAEQTMTINAEIQLADKPGEKGTLIKTGDGTLVLNTASSNSGSMDIQQGVLSLWPGGLDPELNLIIRANATVVLVGNNTINGLSFDDGTTWEADGTWGALGSGAQYESSRFSGTGWLVVGMGPMPPVFTVDPINLSNAVAGSAYSGTLAGTATDDNVGDILTYSALSGPVWLNVAADGVLSGTPGSGDAGPNSWLVQVSDGEGGTDTATLNISVTDSAGPTTLLSDDFEGTLADWSTDWDLVTSYYVSSNHAVECSDTDNDLISKDLNASGATTNVRVQFKYRINNIDGNDNVTIYYWDGSTYDAINEIGDDAEDKWLTYDHTTTDAQYRNGTFKIYIEGSSIDSRGSEALWIDDVLITCE